MVKYINTLFRAFLELQYQWVDYTVMGEVFVVLVEWIPWTQTFVVYEAPYGDGKIHDLQLRLVMALGDFREVWE